MRVLDVHQKPHVTDAQRRKLKLRAHSHEGTLFTNFGTTYFFFLLFDSRLNVTPINMPTTTKPTTNNVAGMAIAYSLDRKNLNMTFPSSTKG